jgi:hypothetical protein
MANNIKLNYIKLKIVNLNNKLNESDAKFIYYLNKKMPISKINNH